MKPFQKAFSVTLLASSLLFSTHAMAAGNVTIAVNQTIDSLDPYNTNLTVAQAIGKGWYEGLFEFDKDLKIHPLLATGYEVSPDGLAYTLKLRDNVLFQDGAKFDAQAVKANIERILDKSNALARYNQFKDIDKVEIVDPLTVKVVLKRPFSAFINILAHPSSMMISPDAIKKYGKEIGFHPVGTGKFKFEKWDQAQSVSMVKNDAYWDKSALAKVDEITFKFVPDNNTRAAIMQTGEAQFTYPVPYEQVDVLRKNSNLIVDATPSIVEYYVSLNTLVKPFDNPKVRQALNYAINKEAFNKVVFRGYADTATGAVPDGIEYATKYAPYKYDIAKAKKLLGEAGYPNGFKTTLWASNNNTTGTKTLQFLQQQLRLVGVDASVEALETGQRVQKVQQVAKPEDAKVRMYFAGWSASTGEANWALSPLLAGDAWPPVFNNTAYYKNDQVDSALINALKTTDSNEKAKFYKEAQDQIYQDAPWIFLSVAKNISAKSNKVHDVYVMPDGSFYFKNASIDN